MKNESSLGMSVSRTLVKRLTPSNAVLLLCDLQEKFKPSVKYFNEIITNSKRLLDAAKMLDMKIIATEQYPKGLGHVVPEMELEKNNIAVFEKKKFSMCIPSVEELLGSTPNTILCGVEAHVCVFNTAYDLLEKGIGVHVVADAVASRSQTDRIFALRQLERAGAVVTTTENVIMGLLGSADHPRFRDVQKVIMELGPDTGLLQSAL